MMVLNLKMTSLLGFVKMVKEHKKLHKKCCY